MRPGGPRAARPWAALMLGLGMVIAAGPARAQADAVIGLRGVLPVVCSAGIVSIEVRPAPQAGLLVVVEHACNAPHELRVLVNGVVVAPGQLRFSYGGRAPDWSGDTGAGFRSTQGVRARRELRLAFDGSAEDLAAIRQGLSILVAPM